MEAYQERLIDEHTELTERTDKLSRFIQSPEFAKLSMQEQSYLDAQLPLMVKLRDVLSSRVAAMELKEPTPAPAKAAPAPAPAAHTKAKDK